MVRLRTSSRPSRAETGAAAVELAIVLPLLLIIVGAVVDLGREYSTQVQLTNAAREGARFATVIDPSRTVVTVSQRVKAATTTDLGSTLSVTGTVTDMTTGVNTSLPCTSTGQTVTIKVTGTFEWLILPDALKFFTSNGGSLPNTISSYSTMQCGS